ncbi:MAG TPA: DEAD/DEAH box helicase [Geobacteraceae bacterium]|nr:DEAD/DEAH box helicase [Geobacteraceae bacterium]
MDDSLKLFHPLVARWFIERVGMPTRIQSMAWREIASGGHLLATAPTGSGKTLAAFLWAIDRLITGKWTGGMTRILYVSPLKALNNDIRRNLLFPLQELEGFFAREGQPFPRIRVMTRSGDTPADERRALMRHPPEILITTPESLNIMLTGKNGGALFQGVRTVILDEIHAVAATKRGTHLITAVERLTLFSGEFQRIALSATVRPQEIVADFIGGFERMNGHGEAACRKRPVAILRSDDDKRYSITIESPKKPDEEEDEETLWRNLALELKGIALENRSTLIFTKSRRVAEKIARYINEGEEEIIAYSHHGSIAREIRLEVEERMKRGELRAIVATSSLELGIDIGELDEVILVQTPFSISSSLQRLGRAGHGVGETSRGRLYPAHGMDYLTAAVMARCMEEKVTEPLHPQECPLDVLAQVIVSMTASERWEIDDLYAFFKCCYPYRNLTTGQYRLVLEMLAGRYAESRIKDLAPRISIDRIDNTVEAKSGASFLLYTSGGTIPDRGYYDLRVKESRAKIGELDEEFVWERRIGDTFTLGTQIWRIQNITHNAVEVSPLKVKTGMVPFWRAEEQDRDFYYAERIMDFLREADERLSDAEKFRRQLETGHAMSPESALALTEFLLRQKEACAKKLPHRNRIVIEHYNGGTGRAVGRQTILHTMWGGRLNRPFSMALAAAWEKKHGLPLEVYTGDANILLVLPNDAKVTDAIRMVTPENVEELLRERLESSGFFGAKFRENAARALLLPRAGFHRRYPLWLNRLRARRLHEAVMRFADFPIVLETWRECLQDAFDLPNLKMMLDELQTGQIEFTEVENEVPSPFCGSLIWRQTNKYMYEDDTSESRAPSGLSRKLLDEVLYSSQLRPRIARHLASELEGRLQRLRPGYAPSTPAELMDWLKERLLIPADEWQRLLDACRRDSQDFPADIPETVTKKIVSFTLQGSDVSHICALENMPLLKRLFPVAGTDGHPSGVPRKAAEGEMDRADFVAQWLSYYGPVDRSWMEEALGIRGDDLDSLLEGLVEEGRIIVDTILEGSETVEVCYADNLDRLLRMARLARQPSFQALPVDHLPLFIASYQGLARPGETIEDLQYRLEKLFGYPAPAHLWEEDILPARMANYQPAWLDALMNSSPLLWYGAGKEAAAFALETELDIFVSPHQKDREKAEALFPDTRGKYDLFHIASHTALNTEEATRRLWELTWKSAVANDSMETLRKGILNGFQAAALDIIGHGGRNHGRRSAMHRWVASRPIPGNWRMLDVATAEPEGIERQELARERARMLFDRYGILFREILENEAEPLRWRRLFPILRLMELSGEIMSGYFFEGIPGVQFISFEAFRFLRDGLDEDRIYWLNAKDPASLCGIGLEGLKGKLPRRIPSNHIVFQGKRVVIESMKNCRELRIHIPPDHPRLPECLEMFKVLLSRGFNPVKGIVIEKINGVATGQSEYRDMLREFGFTSAYNGLELRRKY